jgi:hypothetical protein
MSATIRETNVFTDAWNTIFTKLNTLTDPDGKSKWIYSAFPEKSVDKRSDYPIIVINPIDVSYSPLTLSNIKEGPLKVTIEVYSNKASELDTICDQIIDKFESSEKNFVASGIAIMKLANTSYGQYSRDNLRIHNKTIVYEFDYEWF